MLFLNLSKMLVWLPKVAGMVTIAEEMSIEPCGVRDGDFFLDSPKRIDPSTGGSNYGFCAVVLLLHDVASVLLFESALEKHRHRHTQQYQKPPMVWIKHE